jgi:ABC-2 type transport system permease protein
VTWSDPLSGNGTTFGRVLASEWTKLTGLTSTLWLAAGTVFVAVSTAFGLGLFVRPGSDVSGISVAASGQLLAQFGVLVLGVVVGAGEFSTGTATTTFTAVPRRVPVLAAQVLLTTAAALAIASAALVASALATAGARRDAGLVLHLDDPGTLRLAIGYVLFLTGVAVLGLGLGALLRHPGAAFVAAVVLLVIVDRVLAANPGPVTDVVRSLLPAAGGPALAAWTVALVGAAAHRLRHHDVGG